MAIRILLKTIFQIFGNLATAIRISWLWMLIFFASLAGFLFTTDTIFVIFFAITTAISSIISTVAIAVAWHRYILRGENTIIFYIINIKWPNISYFFNGMKLFLAMLLIMIPVGFIYMIFIAVSVDISANDTNNSIDSLISLSLIFLFIISFSCLFIWFFIRFSLILAAAAVGKPIGLDESFKITEGLKGTIFLIAILIILLNTLVILLDPLQSPIFSSNDPGMATLVASLALQAIHIWISMFLGIGLVTVLYGHLVEGREL